jgi:[ribosomal protein S5]-alanine N-acetyltransferase
MKKPYLKMPEIHFGEYKLRTIKKSDAKDMFEYGKNPEVTRYLNWGPFTLLSEAKQTIKFIFYPRIKEQLPIGYAIVDVKSNKMIGTIDFHSKIKGINGVEIGYVLHQDYWNKGIMTKALVEMIQIGFDYLNYDLLRIKHVKNNAASQKVIEKAGFTFKSKIPYTYEKQKMVINDELLIYELLKEDYHVSQQS